MLEDLDRRQTGRTTKLLKKSLEYVGIVPTVRVVCHNMNMAQHAKKIFMDLLHGKPDKVSQDKVVLKDTEYIFQSIHQVRNNVLMKDHIVLYDHIVLGEL